METKDILKHLRKKAGYNSGQEFCKAANISFNTYQNYEAGKRTPTAEILIKIADFYGVTTDYLLGRNTGEPEPIEVLASRFDMTALEKEILDNYLALPKDTRGDMMEFLQKSVKKVLEKSDSVQSTAQSQIRKNDTYNSEFAVARSYERDFLNVPDEETEKTFTRIEPDPDF